MPLLIDFVLLIGSRRQYYTAFLGYNICIHLIAWGLFDNTLLLVLKV